MVAKITKHRTVDDRKFMTLVVFKIYIFFLCFTILCFTTIPAKCRLPISRPDTTEVQKFAHIQIPRQFH